MSGKYRNKRKKKGNNELEKEDKKEELKNEEKKELEKKEDEIIFENLYDDNSEEKLEQEKEKEEEKEQEKEQEQEENKNEIINKKCSLDEHKEIDAIFYCQEYKINMCHKCEKVHSSLLKNHHIYSIEKEIKDIFTGLCLNKDHSLELEFYCKTHNELCCAACISKVKINGKGKHNNCEVYHITKIKNDKKLALEKNIKKLEELSKELEPSIKALKNIFGKINESKEKLKKEIQVIFTKIRTELNNREDKLFEQIVQKFDEIFYKEEFIKESEKLPNLVKLSLEKGKIQDNEWNDKSKLNKLINDCIIIEKTIKNINDIYDKVKVFNSQENVEFEFKPKKDEIDKGIINDIKNFGDFKIIKDNKFNDIGPNFIYFREDVLNAY